MVEDIASDSESISTTIDSKDSDDWDREPSNCSWKLCRRDFWQHFTTLLSFAIRISDGIPDVRKVVRSDENNTWEDLQYWQKYWAQLLKSYTTSRPTKYEKRTKICQWKLIMEWFGRTLNMNYYQWRPPTYSYTVCSISIAIQILMTV